MRYIAIIFVIALLGIVSVLTFSSIKSNFKTKPSTDRVVQVTDYVEKDTAKLVFTQQGKLVGEDQRSALRIIITPTTRTVQLLSNYEERVERSKEYPNTQDAFETFVRALDGMGYGKQREVRQSDVRAACPFGNRYLYGLEASSDIVFLSWSDSCKPSDGTFAGGSSSAQNIRKLFQAQITDYRIFTKDTDF